MRVLDQLKYHSPCINPIQRKDNVSAGIVWGWYLYNSKCKHISTDIHNKLKGSPLLRQSMHGKELLQSATKIEFRSDPYFCSPSKEFPSSRRQTFHSKRGSCKYGGEGISSLQEVGAA